MQKIKEKCLLIIPLNCRQKLHCEVVFILLYMKACANEPVLMQVDRKQRQTVGQKCSRLAMPACVACPQHRRQGAVHHWQEVRQPDLKSDCNIAHLIVITNFQVFEVNV